MVIRVVDLGSACKTNSEDGQKGIRSDVLNALRIFSALFLGEEFHSQKDLEDNWRTKLFQRVCTVSAGHNLNIHFLLLGPHSAGTL